MITFIFGDSITQGYWDSKGGWADRLRTYCFDKDIQNNLKYYHGVHNLGIDGNTTSQVQNRIEQEVRARLWPKSSYGFIFAIGVNDTVHRNGSEFISDPTKYSQQLTDIIVSAKKHSDNIAFLNILPVDENLTNPLTASSSGKCFTNDRIALFNSVLETTCTRNKVEFIDVATLFKQQNYSDLLADGLHPNDAGHELIFTTVLPTVSAWMYANNHSL